MRTILRSADLPRPSYNYRQQPCDVRPLLRLQPQQVAREDGRVHVGQVHGELRQLLGAPQVALFAAARLAHPLVVDARRGLEWEAFGVGGLRSGRGLEWEGLE
eukprot:141282-Chlamydomonas_euryale.AAC.1